MAVYTSLDQIPMFRYSLIMADYPWQYENWGKPEDGEARGAEAHYELMDLEDLYKIALGDFCGPNSIVWFWTTTSFADHAFKILDHCGFKFVTMGFWGKVQKKDPTKPKMNGGRVLRECGEPYIIAKIGKPEFPANDIPALILEPARESGRKPDKAYRHAERMTPRGGYRLDLFSRQRRQGWDQCGNQVDYFPPEVLA